MTNWKQISNGDWWWERVIKPRFPQLREWDRVYDQSHVHHTLTILLLYGGFGTILGTALTLAWWPPIFAGPVNGLAWGIAFGIARYIVREASGLIRPRHRASRWDGTLDVLVPAWVLLPWASLEITTGVQWWSAAALYGMGAAVALLYSFGRPRGVLHYGDESRPPI